MEDVDWNLPIEQEELRFEFKEACGKRTQPEMGCYRK